MIIGNDFCLFINSVKYKINFFTILIFIISHYYSIKKASVHAA